MLFRKPAGALSIPVYRRGGKHNFESLAAYLYPLSVLFDGARLFDLLSCEPMIIAALLTLSIFWNFVNTLPGLLESLGYLFGILLASFTLGAYFERNAE